MCGQHFTVPLLLVLGRKTIEEFVNFVLKCIGWTPPHLPESHFLPVRKAQRPEKALTTFLATREQKAEKVPGTTKSVVQKTAQISCTDVL